MNYADHIPGYDRGIPDEAPAEREPLTPTDDEEVPF